MKYKVGDKVRIKSLDWYNENKDDYGYVWCTEFLFTPEHSKYCGRELTISHITEFEIPSYVMESNGHDWTAEMIEGLVEEKTLIERVDDNGLPFNEWLSHKGAFHVPEDYVLKDENGNVINATKIVLEKKEKEYPKTYEECCKVLDVCSGETLQYGDLTLLNDYEFNLYTLLENFRKLLICRDAYWKIAGDWRPEFRFGKKKYCIMTKDNKVINATVEETNRILAFPTAEMRDAFYDNFKNEIEICKEFL